MKNGTLKDGTVVALDSPMKCEDDESKYQVYVETDRGVIKVIFSGKPAAVSSSSKLNPAYWNEKVAGVKERNFNHSAFLDSSNKKIRSVRDGIQEYFGAEIGELPSDKLFKIHRSADEVAKLAPQMNGLPLIAEHIDPDIEPDPKDVLTSITDTEVVECVDDKLLSTVCLEHMIPETLDVLDAKSNGLNEFSLGYRSKWREAKESDPWDFEQYDFKPPAHLAMVNKARGGKSLSFIDKKGNDMPKLEKVKKFLDESGEITMEDLSDVVTNFPEKIKNMDISQLKKLIIPFLAKADLPVEDEEAEEKDKKIKDEEAEDKVDETVKLGDMSKDDREKFTDSALYKSILLAARKDKSFLDSKTFIDAVTIGVKERTAVIEKSKSFLDSDFDFDSKSTNEIMEKAVATQSDKKFKDSQLEAAFEMLKANEKYKNFGDGINDDDVEKMKNKEY